MGRREAVKNTVHNDGLSLRVARAVGGIIAPDRMQLRYVGAVDLIELRVTNPFGTAAVCGPVAVGLRADGSAERGQGSDPGNGGERRD